jgi:hypothetical protein
MSGPVLTWAAPPLVPDSSRDVLGWFEDTNTFRVCFFYSVVHRWYLSGDPSYTPVMPSQWKDLERPPFPSVTAFHKKLL